MTRQRQGAHRFCVTAEKPNPFVWRFSNPEPYSHAAAWERIKQGKSRPHTFFPSTPCTAFGPAWCAGATIRSTKRTRRMAREELMSVTGGEIPIQDRRTSSSIWAKGRLEHLSIEETMTWVTAPIIADGRPAFSRRKIREKRCGSNSSGREYAYPKRVRDTG